MRNLIYFLNRNSFFFLFLFLETICFLLIFRYNHYQRASYLNSSNNLVGKYYELETSTKNYFGLQGINQDLATENQLLFSELCALKEELENSSVKNKKTQPSEFPIYNGARVINISTNKQHNFATLNKGYRDGLKKDMAVISSEGVVGIVKDVSKNFSSVITVLHKGFVLSTKVRHKEYLGSLTWDGRLSQFAQIEDLPGHASIAIGDTIVTSGYSSIFPENIEVGTVQEVATNPGSSFKKLQVKLAVDFTKLRNVYLFNKKNKEEQLELESKVVDE